MAETDTPKQIDDLALALLLSRLETQDKVQGSILREVKKTNGTVIDLKARVSIIEATNVDARVTALEEVNTLADDRLTQAAARTTRRDTRITRITQVACVLTGAGLVDVGHILHLW